MVTQSYALSEFISDLRRITQETHEDRVIISGVRPLVQRLALSKVWLKECYSEANSQDGYGVHLLHQEPDHTLIVIAVSWLPGTYMPPHNHGTWAVVAGIDGAEKNIFWKRIDDCSRPGYAELKQVGEKICCSGDVLGFLPDTIHSLINEMGQTSLSLHVYGRHLNYTGRSQFDPEKKAESSFIF